MRNYSRKEFLKTAGLAAGMVPFASTDWAYGLTQNKAIPDIHIFSKHLHFLNYQEMAETAKGIGFQGIDLTVRPNGHVEPKNVEKDLPQAVQAVKDAGLKMDLITTAVDSAEDKIDCNILNSASEYGIHYYRMNWFDYPKDASMPEALEELQDRVSGLSELNKKLGIVGCYQNHSGTLVGASLWEVWKLLQKANKEYMGAQYDIRHAMIEGGRSWTNGVRLIHSYIKTLVLKDVKWENQSGEWKLKNVPIGEGMVDFISYFRLLKKYDLRPPVSLHLEYPLGGAEHGAHKISINHSEVYKAMEKDLITIKQLWREA